MASEGRIIEVMLGTEFSDYDRRTGDNKTRPKMVQAVRTENRSKGQFGSLFFIPFITLGRLAIASERTG